MGFPYGDLALGQSARSGDAVEETVRRSILYRTVSEHARALERLTIGVHGRLTAEEARKEARLILANSSRARTRWKTGEPRTPLQRFAELCDQYLKAAEAGEILKRVPTRIVGDRMRMAPEVDAITTDASAKHLARLARPASPPRSARSRRPPMPLLPRARQLGRRSSSPSPHQRHAPGHDPVR
jgi:hypothetical protein